MDYTDMAFVVRVNFYELLQTFNNMCLTDRE